MRRLVLGHRHDRDAEGHLSHRDMRAIRQVLETAPQGVRDDVIAAAARQHINLR